MPSYSTTRGPVTPIFAVILSILVEYSADSEPLKVLFKVEFFSSNFAPKTAALIMKLRKLTESDIDCE